MGPAGLLSYVFESLNLNIGEAQKLARIREAILATVNRR